MKAYSKKIVTAALSVAVALMFAGTAFATIPNDERYAEEGSSIWDSLPDCRASQYISGAPPNHFFISKLPFRNHTETEGRWEVSLTNCPRTTAGGWSC